MNIDQVEGYREDPAAGGQVCAFRPMTILNISRDGVQRRIVRSALDLAEDHHRLLESDSLFDAERMLEADPVDCVLLDICQPDGSGLAFAERIAGAPAYRDTALILMVAKPSASLARYAFGLGIQHCIPKCDVTPQAIAALIALAVSRVKPLPASDPNPEGACSR